MGVVNDDDRYEWLAVKPPNRLRRIGCGSVAMLTLICACGVLATVGANAFGPEDHEVSPVALTAGGTAGVILLAWGVFAVIRGYWHDWRLRRNGEIVSATIDWKDSNSDGDGGYTWQMRVSGRTRAGDTFSRSLSTGYRPPREVGSRVDVRYYAPLKRIALVERGLGAMITTIIGELFSLGILAAMLYLIVAIIHGVVRLWT